MEPDLDPLGFAAAEEEQEWYCAACGAECEGVDECFYCFAMLCGDCANEYDECCSLCYDLAHEGEDEE